MVGEERDSDSDACAEDRERRDVNPLRIREVIGVGRWFGREADDQADDPAADRPSPAARKPDTSLSNMRAVSLRPLTPR
jgi:hypothetical protein